MTSPLEPLLLPLWQDLRELRVLWQLAVLLPCVTLAWWLSLRVRPRAGAQRLDIGIDGLRRLAFPLGALALVLAGRAALAHYQSVSLLNVAVPLLAALAIIRVVVYMLRLVFAPGSLLASFESTLAWLVWIGFALHILGLASDLLDFLDGVSFHVGAQRISLLLVGQAALWVVGALLLALWAGRVVEERVMAAHSMDVTLRVMVGKLSRALLVLFAVLIALPAVGIDLTALSVFGGALGVGIGFGLQKIASNYISGFIILLDRSVTIGDLVTIETHTGKLTKMTARYVVVRALDGTEAIIPNETVISSTVVNQSYTDRRVCVAVPVRVSYQSDLELAMKLMVEVARRHPRALASPAPGAGIKEFADNGVALELGVWVQDPEEGSSNLRADIYLGLWREFRAHGIEFALPQRVALLGAAAADAPPRA